ANNLLAQESDAANRKTSELAAKEFFKKEFANYNSAVAQAKSRGWALEMIGKNNAHAKLIGIDRLGKPVYFKTFNNTVSA
ncbi:hypothetical protein ABTM77_21270, partial [Acinetobacter baumannii]